MQILDVLIFWVVEAPERRLKIKNLDLDLKKNLIFTGTYKN